MECRLRRIYRANVVLEKVPGIEMDEVLNRIFADKFIRASFYYNLNTMFGGVPLVDKSYHLPSITSPELRHR
jgi:hypothetical protein